MPGDPEGGCGSPAAGRGDEEAAVGNSQSRPSPKVSSRDAERPSTKYKRPQPPSPLKLRRAAAEARAVLPRRQSPRTWRVVSTERFPLRSSVRGTARAGKVGELIANNGDRYLGEVLAGRPNGHGQYLVQAGDTYVVQYEGEFVNGVRSGYGIRHYFNGEVYKGQWDSDMRHGQGRMEYLNGDIYDGEWLEDRREGTATFLHGNGDVFVGTFLDDKKEGLGTLYLVSKGRKYIAEYSQGAPRCGSIVDVTCNELSPVTDAMWGTLSTMRGSVNHVSIPPGRLPTLELEQPFKTLTQEIINIRKDRFDETSRDGRGSSQVGGTLHPLDLELLWHSFTQLVGGDGRKVGMIPTKLTDLFRLSSLDPSDRVTREIAQKLFDLRKKDDSILFEDFLRVVGHFRNFELESGEFQRLQEGGCGGGEVDRIWREEGGKWSDD